MRIKKYQEFYHGIIYIANEGCCVRIYGFLEHPNKSL
jgi:hypothetical protein